MEQALNPEILRYGLTALFAIVLFGLYKLADRALGMAESWIEHQIKIGQAMFEGMVRMTVLIEQLHIEVKEYSELLRKANGK